jgi:glucosamine kinase
MPLPSPVVPPTQNAARSADATALGLDAGGTATRWALADARGVVVSEGLAGPVSGLQLTDEAGQAAVLQTLQYIAQATGNAAPQSLVAGITGFGPDSVPVLCDLAARAFGMAKSHVSAMSDIELACHAAFAPGQGYVVYAGTGSIAAFLDTDGALDRAGGRGAVIDDAGGGHWIAREALRHIWRAEDEAPGSWRQSPLALQVFERIGGADWALTRHWVYGASRGELGTLALAVAAAAEEDSAALQLLHNAGGELARLALALLRRHGTRPIALAGRVWDLHPVIESALRQALPADTAVTRQVLPAHHAAAQVAAQSLRATRTSP